MKTWLFILLFSLSTSLYARDVYVLKSSGVCDGCAEAVSKMLISAGIKSQILGPEDLKKWVKEDDMLIVGGGIPGGEGEWTIKQDLMRVGAFDWLKKFIYNGGRYIGICAGAYLTEEWIDKDSNEPGLNIFPGVIDNYSKRDKSAKYLLIHVADTNAIRSVYFQDGPGMYPSANAEVNIFATFTKDKSPAALSFSYGKGKVGLISPHLEADYEWQNDSRTKDLDIRDYDLGSRFIKQVLE